MSKFRKGDVVEYGLELSKIGIIKSEQVTDIMWNIMVEEDHQDTHCFEENIEKTEPPLNVFDLIREKTV